MEHVASDALAADFNPSSGLRGVCAGLIVCGHFFDLYAPRSIRFFGFDASLPGCDGDDAKTLGQCYPPGSLDGAYPKLTIMYVTPVALFFAISGALFGYLYYDSFHCLDPDAGTVLRCCGGEAPAYTNQLSWCAFMSKRYRRIAPQLWASLLWLAPFFFFGTLGAFYTADIKIMDLIIAPTPLFVLQPLLLMGLEWNPIMWQVSNLFVCYMCVPTLLRWLKSEAVGRARCPTASSQHATLELSVDGVTMLSSLLEVTGSGFWLCWAYTLVVYWLLYYTFCDAECIATSLGEMLVHMPFYTRAPQFVMGFYVGVALREEELIEDLLRSGGARLTSGGAVLRDSAHAVAAYRAARPSAGWLRVLIVDGLFFGWLGFIVLIAITGDGWTGATRSAAYDLDLQFWLAPLHCLWLYHAARLPAAAPAAAPVAQAYAALTDEASPSAPSAVPSAYSTAGSQPPPPPRSYAAAFLSSAPMLHLGELSYGIYICQLGALTTVTWYHNEFSVPTLASWLPDAAASWGTFGLEVWHLAEVWLLLVGVVQLVELLAARVAKRG